MRGSKTAPRILLVAAIVTLVVAIVGFIVTLLLDVFVLDKYNAYGEVPIPGSASLHLPEGEVTVSFHTRSSAVPMAVGFEPTEDGIRIQQLKTLAALRDSGALTEDEFESEKRRLLDGG